VNVATLFFAALVLGAKVTRLLLVDRFPIRSLLRPVIAAEDAGRWSPLTEQTHRRR
jgi:hypothetical protein